MYLMSALQFKFVLVNILKNKKIIYFIILLWTKDNLFIRPNLMSILAV